MLNNFSGDTYSIQEKGHGRTETRFSLVEHDTSLLGDIAFDWQNIQTLGVVVSVRQEASRKNDYSTIY